MQQKIIMITPDELIEETKKLKDDRYRLTAISCTNKNGMELSYSFDKNYEMLTYRLLVSMEEEVPSISEIYPYAFLYENEIKELFGVKISNIILDFQGNLYKISEQTPFYTDKSKKEDE